ncbi:hypothetical protein THASP1DRAFT_20794 [Thamnocephalis sphaerospora]|uniref:Oxidoreductase n=1 Tax=Thamnocephalis sphaerospora TaxID=78915 RepID=A0A4P9XGG9_9FUNG|nr:hypothetical protein THASP1DRAFT_20794 [Thamnocephalis sphaerospora]|eukprot:RKP04724.1 hypothetical protein THASP1DRAFT_20794 [Thamnocephalis sphaerospora]
MATAHNTQNTVVLVTGCTQGGIGYGLCCEFAQRGCTVYATARRIEAMSDLQALGIKTLKLDVTDKASIINAVKEVLAAEGHIDILVNNAGMSCTAPLLDQDLDAARRVYETNVWGPLAVAQAVAPSMMTRRAGTIVNVGSIVGHCATPWSGVYSSSKAAIHAWTNSMRVELRPYGVNMTLVYPGSIQSNIAQNAQQRFEWKEDSLFEPYKKSVLHRMVISQAPGCTTTKDFCRYVIPRILRASPPQEIYYGTLSTKFWLLSFLPVFIKVRTAACDAPAYRTADAYLYALGLYIWQKVWTSWHRR